ncbi:DNRLRE domain-containing protein [Bacillus sp. RIT 809]|uniref:DNRLRE domain-containing protein n=1 Tax=Bacillus sp. RIT 809 TaxID=2803857 RepID=UPI0019514029|nr:DNRLRE domain-containing protein [Bacillus sp. RIT 809]MBM6648997.1 DNRLRE domain-containing protein [Bacillus sp. RIT 809]
MSNTFKVGEMLNKRSPFSKTFMNFDGSYTTEVRSTLVHYTDTEGNLHNVNTALFDEATMFKYQDAVEVTGADMLAEAKDRSQDDKDKGTLNHDEYDYQGAKVPFSVRIPRIFSRGYTVGDGEESITFTPVGASPSKGYITANKPSEIAYQDAWNDADVKLELKEDGVKETIIMKTDKAPSKYRFEVTGGLSEDLSIGNIHLAPAWLTDANGTYRDVNQVLVVNEESLVTYVELTVDTTDLVYPITVDPTVIINSDASNNRVDNSISSATPTTVDLNPYGGSINKTDTLRFMCKYPNLMSTIPKGSLIGEATLQLDQYFSDGNGTKGIVATAITNDYNTSTVTWNNQPVYSSSLISPIVTFPDNNLAFKIDVKNIIQGMTNGSSVYGFMLKAAAPLNGTASFALMGPSNIEERPILSVTFNTPPSKPVVTVPNGGETWNSLETIRWTQSTDSNNLNYTPVDPATGLSLFTETMYGESFIVLDDRWVVSNVGLYMKLYDSAAVTTVAGKLRLVNVLANNTIGTTIQETAVTIAKGAVVKHSMAMNRSFNKGVKLGIVFVPDNGVAYQYQAPIAQKSVIEKIPSCGVIKNGSVDLTREGAISVDYSDGTPQNELKYQIQLSSNNGSTWKDIVPLTDSGISSLAYDFINEPESSTSKVRIRAYDGFIYGDWDESDGVFTILHNQAPVMPTNLAPNGTILDRAVANRLSWNHNDPNSNDPQSKFDIQWRVQGNANWTTITQATTNQYYDTPVNLFPAGKIEWQVRTYDQAGVSGPYSNVIVFTAAVRSAPPQVTYPTNGAIVPISSPVISWSHPSQVRYWVKVKSNTGTVVFEDQKTSVNKAVTVSTSLVNNSSYSVEIAVMDNNGLWSTFVVVPFSVSYTPPNKPVISPVYDHIRGYIRLEITNPTPTGTVPKVSYMEVFRKGDNNDWIKLASGVQEIAGGTPWTDYTPTPEKDEMYMVRAYGVNGTFVDSAPIISCVSLKDVQIVLASDPSKYVALRKREAGKEVTGRQAVTSEFAGRPYPLTEFGSNHSRTFDYRYKIESWNDVLLIRQFAQAGEAFVLRDNWGKKDFVTFNSVDIEESRYFWYASLQPTKVYYAEGIE